MCICILCVCVCDENTQNLCMYCIDGVSLFSFLPILASGRMRAFDRKYICIHIVCQAAECQNNERHGDGVEFTEGHDARTHSTPFDEWRKTCYSTDK